ncbi:Ig-like domain-containing protein [Shewanella marina]|uniref:Ig-like domain-containing protein n=1 Tax=Shewanella marina TaxID=487319 RepID=UPI0022773D93|nr:Ig-like domain-containing protein [Shewanella marina]
MSDPSLGNHAPLATNLVLTTYADSPITASLTDISSDHEQDPLSFKLVQASSRFSLTDDQISYSPAGFIGVEQAVYQVSDSHGGYSLAYVLVNSIDSQSANQAPIALDYQTSFDASLQQQLVLNLTDLGLISDKEGDELSLVQVFGVNNRARVDGNGQIVYQPKDYRGVDQFSYQISDGQGGYAIASITIQVASASLIDLNISPDITTIPKGAQAHYQLHALYSDGRAEPVMDGVVWQLNTNDVASINQQGTAVGLTQGNVQVTAQFAGMRVTAELLVEAEELLDLAIYPALKSLPKGVEQQYMARATYSDGSARDVTEFVDWSTLNQQLVAISAIGVATAKDIGVVNIQAKLGDLVANAELTVTAAELTSMRVTPEQVSVPVGISSPYYAAATYTDGTTLALIEQVHWSLVKNDIASLNRYGLATGKSQGDDIISAIYAGQTASAKLVVTPPILVGITLLAQHSAIPVGVPANYSVLATYSDGNSYVLDAKDVNWGLSAPEIAHIDITTGNVIGSSTGVVIINAMVGELQTSAELQITDAVVTAIKLMPEQYRIPKGESLDYHVIASYSDGVTRTIAPDEVQWQSTQPLVASVLVSNGNAIANSVGVTEIKANFRQHSTVAQLEVTAAELVNLIIHPEHFSIAAGGQTQFQITGVYSDGLTRVLASDELNWHSSNSDVATVLMPTGMVTAYQLGQAQISAKLAGLSVSSLLNVTDAELVSLNIKPAKYQMPIGSEVNYQITGRYSNGESRQLLPEQLSWRSQDQHIASVIATDATAFGNDVGVTQIIVEKAGLKTIAELTISDAVINSLSITPATSIVPKGEEQVFAVSANYSNGESRQLNAKELLWRVEDANTASVIGETGRAIGLEVGQTQVIATIDNKSVSAALTVSSAQLQSIALLPATASIPVGLTQDYKVIGRYSDGVTRPFLASQIQWQSGQAEIATIETADGIVTGHSEGQINIVAKFGAFSAESQLTVSSAILESIRISPNPLSLALGESVQVVIYGQYSDGVERIIEISDANLSSSNSGIVSIDGSQGLIQADQIGSSNITVKVGGKTVNLEVTVTDALLTAISMTPMQHSMPLGHMVTYQVMGHYSDNSRRPLASSDVQWRSSQPAIATVAAHSGVAQSGGTTGSTHITATVAGYSITAELTVTSAELLSISLTPRVSSIALGQSVDYQVLGLYSDDSTSVIAVSDINIYSSNPSVAVIAAGTLSVTSHAAGDTIFTATVAGKKATAELVVTSKVIESLALDANQYLLGVGSLHHIKVIAQYSDGSTQVLDANQLTFVAQQPDIVSVSNGIAAGVSLGSAIVNASLNNQPQITVAIHFTVIDSARQNVCRAEHRVCGYKWGKALGALTQNGGVKAWGYADRGGLVPVNIANQSGFTRMIANARAFTAMRDDGSIVAWGDNLYGGYYAGSDSFADVYAADLAFAGLTFNGEIKVWGSANHGGFGAPVGTGFTHIYSTQYAFAALRTDGSIVAWGGQNTGGSGAPIDAGYISIAGTGGAFAALKHDGTITAWGDAGRGGVGAPTDNGYIKIVAADYIFAALKADGSIVTWGYEDPNLGYLANPTAAEFIDVRASSLAFSAIRADGSIFAWGASYQGGVEAPVDNGYSWLKGINTAFAAQRTDGTISLWGHSTSLTQSPAVEEKFTVITGNDKAFAAIAEDGSIRVWGEQDAGGNQAKAPLGDFQ